ncbi:MAG: HEAT repeat domain-containing protein, partial [Planctomycetota bacterium]
DEYRDVLFSCDWSQGQILAFRLEPKGASYRASREVFLEGRPMNVTDIDVGPDGWLYFCTGGRGTQGNLYRIIRTENRDARLSKLETVPQALQHPQPNSAWGRQRLSLLRRKLGTTWDTQLREFANNPSNPVDERRRALALMHLVGPPPTDLDLARYSKDANASVRIQVADLMGLIGNDVTHDRLIQLLADRNPRVRRHALEALARSSRQVSWEVLTPSLKSTDRFEAWAARRLLERNQSEVWPDQVLEASDPSLFIQGALASMIALPDTNRAIAIVARAQEMMGGFIPAREEIGVLRLIQVAMLRGQLQGGDVPGLGELLLKRFPQDDAHVNREMIRLLVGIQHAPAIPAMVQYLQSDIPDVDKIHVATLIQFMESGWPPAGKFALLQFFEQAKLMEGGQNLSAYIKTIADEVANGLTVGEQMYVIQQGHLMPEAALTAMFALPESKDIEMIPRLMQVDQALIPFKGIAYDRLRIGIVAILARSKSPEAMGYLRQIHDRDPERRQTVAMGLAQTPDGRNWDYLVRSIPLLSGEPAREVLTQLRTVDYAPEAPEHLRQVILCGLRLQADGGLLATKLLEHWVGTRPPGARGDWQAQLAAWQIWFDERYPGEPVADLPTEDGGNTWTFEDLQAYLSSPEAESRSIENGAVVFEKAQCAACHIHGKQGIHLGPDLTTLARRFQTNEVLESIIYPSQVISDQYASKTVVTSDGKTRTGMVLVQNKQQIVLADPQGKEIKIDASEIEEINPSKLSVMPAGLLNDLSLEEIGDLFAFLMHVEEPRMVEFMEDMDVR